MVVFEGTADAICSVYSTHERMFANMENMTFDIGKTGRSLHVDDQPIKHVTDVRYLGSMVSFSKS